jgi:hypothetical protein
MEMRRKMMIEDHYPHAERSKVNTPLKEKSYCNHCSRDGHNEATCWALHLDIHPKRNKKTKKTPSRETTSHAVLRGNPPPRGNELPEKGQLGKENLFDIINE